MNMDASEQLRPDEEARLAALPREINVDYNTEERTVQRLHERGLLKAHSGAAGRSFRVGGLLAASLLLFFSGMKYGERRVNDAGPGSSPVTEVQRTGTAYVEALLRLSESISPS